MGHHMRISQQTPEKSRFGSRFPFNLFGERREPGNDRFADRLEALHKSVPGTLPERRFFRH